MTTDHIHNRPTQRAGVLAAACVALALALGSVPFAAQAQSAPATTEASAATSGPLRIRQPAQPTATPDPTARGGSAAMAPPPPPAPPGEFELYVRAQAGGSAINRFGADLLNALPSSPDAADYNPLVPADYVIKAGDELVVTMWGSVDADLRLVVDRTGRISIPRVGPVMVSGVKYGELTDTISRRVGLVFKNFQISVALGQLRGIRVYVTGFVAKPGPVMVNSLSTLTQALIRSGGPTAAGSFRTVELRRGKALVANFDLYDFLIRGDRSADQRLEPEDVIHVGPVGTQVAVLGSVNRPAIFELKSGDGVAEALAMAGGLNAVADSRRIALERFEDRGKERVVQLALPQGLGQRLANGDLVRAFNLGIVAQPIGNNFKRVRVEGEVLRPGEYVLPPNSTLVEAVKAAGGTTNEAFLFGAEFMRESVRVLQQENYDRALRDMETDYARQGSQRTSTAEDAAANAARTAAIGRLIERLRSVRPTGRVVLHLPVEGGSLPEILLEDGDHLVIPAKPTSVGVFGSVFNAGSFLYAPNRTLEQYTELAGGPTRGADEDSIFVVRANGTVVSNQQRRGWFSRSNHVGSMPVLPGDTVFIPEDTSKQTFLQVVRDITQILFQFGVGAAGLKTAIQ